jgi:hypothetical protein
VPVDAGGRNAVRFSRFPTRRRRTSPGLKLFHIIALGHIRKTTLTRIPFLGLIQQVVHPISLSNRSGCTNNKQLRSKRATVVEYTVVQPKASRLGDATADGATLNVRPLEWLMSATLCPSIFLGNHFVNSRGTASSSSNIIFSLCPNSLYVIGY